MGSPPSDPLPVGRIHALPPLTQEDADVVQSLWRAANAEPTRADLLQAVAEAHDAMISEYMVCPWCNGPLGMIDKEKHKKDCIWQKVAPLVTK